MFATAAAVPPTRKARTPTGNRTFELNTNAPVGGVLLLHGMSDSPYSLRMLGQKLNRQNYHVIGLRLPGHGTVPSGLRYIKWEDMAAATRLAMNHLAAQVGSKPVHIIGYSTGAPLALNYALDALDGEVTPAPASLVLISPAIRVHSAAALANFKNTLGVVPGMAGMRWLSVLPEFDPYKYNSFATNAGDQVHSGHARGYAASCETHESRCRRWLTTHNSVQVDCRRYGHDRCRHR